MITQYTYIASQLLLKVAELRWIDLDQGQLDAPESYDAILAPACLISFEGFDSNQFASEDEELVSLMTVKTIVPLQNNTHVTQQTDIARIENEKTLAKYQLYRKVKKALCELPSITRKSIKEYYKDTFFVVEQTFHFEYVDIPTLEEQEQDTVTIGVDFDIVLSDSGSIVENDEIVSPVSPDFRAVTQPAYCIKLTIVEQNENVVEYLFKDIQSAIDFAESYSDCIEKRVTLLSNVTIIQAIELKSAIVIDFNMNNLRGMLSNYFSSTTALQAYSFINARSIYTSLCLQINNFQLNYHAN